MLHELISYSRQLFTRSRPFRGYPIGVICLSLSVICVPIGSVQAAEPISFSRDVLPLLSDRCFHCHGPDDAHREADLRLDQQESALDAVIVPGEPADSELLARIASDDPELRMPPPDSHRKEFTEKEVEILRRWIAEGAEWGRHWSFEKPVRPKMSKGEHPIDALVGQRLRQEGLEFSQRAAKETLIRRVSFDLIGLPPTREEVEAFVNDDSPVAFALVVNRLLDSPHYGERMAYWWLDAARYSDTDGYQQDATRTNWPWRDWVIESFNSNMPFDQFTIEQFAGDLLPNATAEQRLATAFHRNHMTNGEGGRLPEESRIDYVIDRVNTTGTVFLGLTLGCAQCHSHKFDPISQEDYYSLFAFFNSIDEDGKAGGGAKPYLKYKSPHAQRAVAEAQKVVDLRKAVEAKARAEAEQEFGPWLADRIDSVRDGFQPWHVLEAEHLESVEGTELAQEDDGTVQASGPILFQDDYRIIGGTELSRVTGIRLEVLPHESHTDGKLSRGKSGEFILTDVKLQVRRRGKSQLRDIEIASAIADAEKNVSGRNYGKVKDTLDDDPRNGWSTETHDPQKPHVAVFALAEPLHLAEDEQLVFVMLHRSTRGDANIGRFRISVTDQPGRAVRSLDRMPLEELAAGGIDNEAEVPGKLRGQLLDQFLADHAAYQQAKQELDDANRQLSTVRKAAGSLNVMVLAERESPRTTHILERGVWDKKGAEVSRSVPQAILPWPEEKTKNRLELAEWLVSPDNPLTARVVVNHLWQLCFGAGLVRTPEDFGLQGELPTHPRLLDWLAVELVESGWDVKHLMKLIVTSRTYQQSSRVTPDLLERDPENKLLARGARYRLPSWMIRDAALRSSGLLNPALGGPPTMPYQPKGVWAENFMGRFKYEPSQGPAQYRRTLYAFWRRASAPTFLFDSAQRRVCEVRPRRTNTPLHALTLLNDESLLEASRALARQSLEQFEDAHQRIDFLFESILSRAPTEKERAVIEHQLEKALKHYRQSDDADKFLAFGQPEQRATDKPGELAGYTIITSLIFNLDEAITHE